MNALTACRCLAAGAAVLLVAAAVPFALGASWYGWALLICGALWGVLSVLACRGYRRSQRETRRQQRGRERLLRDVSDRHASVRTLHVPSAAYLEALWNDEPLRLVPPEDAA